METKGRHLILEISGCDPEVLNSIEKVRDILTEAASRANAEVRETAFHRFYPQGVSGVVVISESHLSVHTWPEHGYAALDIYTCGEDTDPWKALKFAAEEFKAREVYLTSISRGERENGRFVHKITENLSGNLVEEIGEEAVDVVS